MGTQTTKDRALFHLPFRRAAWVICALCVWAIAAALILANVTSWPSFGAKFTSNGGAKPTVVELVRPDGPSAQAGLSEGDEIVALYGADKAKYALTGFEAIPGREMLHSYADATAARAAKATSWDILNSGPVVFELADGRRVSVAPQDGRSIINVPFQAFNFMLQSLIIITIASGILAFAPTTWPVIFLVASGLSMSVNMMLNALSVSSELAMPAAIWAIYDVAVPTALVTFCFGLLALLWSFPSPISRFPFVPILGVIWVLTIFGQTSHLYSFPLHPYQGPYLFTVLPAIVIGIASWRRTRNDPLKRASVMWFVLSIMIGALFSGLFYTLPVALGYPPLISTAVTLFAVTFIYIGLAFGTLRYRLFDIHRIWWRVITWMVGGLLVVVVDILLIATFDFEQSAALPLALFIMGWVYFPIRQFIFGYFVNPGEIRTEDYIQDLIAMFSRSDVPDAIDGRFAQFLKTIFGAQDIARVRHVAHATAQLGENGLSLMVPALTGGGAIDLIGKRGGRQLFSTSDVHASQSMLELVRFMVKTHAHDYQDLQKERERIMRDLHDHVGGQLLSIAYKANDPMISAKARDTLGALKDTLFLIEDTQMVDLTVAWDKYCQDAMARLSDVGFEMNVSVDIQSERTLSAREYINLKRCMQEIVSNIIKYAARSVVAFDIAVDEAGFVQITVENAVDPAGGGRSQDDGRGLTNIRTRLDELGGSVKTDGVSLEQGATFRIRIELPFEE